MRGRGCTVPRSRMLGKQSEAGRVRRWGQMRMGGHGRSISRWGFLLRPGEPPQEVKREMTESGFHLQGTVLPAGGFQGSWGQGVPGEPRGAPEGCGEDTEQWAELVGSSRHELDLLLSGPKEMENPGVSLEQSSGLG